MGIVTDVTKVGALVVKKSLVHNMLEQACLPPEKIRISKVMNP